MARIKHAITLEHRANLGEEPSPVEFSEGAEVVVLKETNHNLGLYYERGGKRMAEFLGRQLKGGTRQHD